MLNHLIHSVILKMIMLRHALTQDLCDYSIHKPLNPLSPIVSCRDSLD